MAVIVLLCLVAVAFAREEVKKTCDEEPEPGLCDAYFPMWYYDVELETCHEFVYGGCQGNGNRYRSFDECMKNCNGDSGLEASAPAACEQPAKTGPCFAYFRRYYFDLETGKCTLFIYGGCAGNENNFRTQEECQKTCGGVSRSAALCDAIPDSGDCRGYFPRFYFDKFSGQCKQFVYTGCGGNDNNFETEEKCNAVCVEVKKTCDEEPETGLCQAYFPMWYYDVDLETCHEFVYGGCQGNGNRYSSFDECMKNCNADSELEASALAACEQPAKTGPCFAYFRRYYFDSETGKCTLFIYGGCAGNENNFRTQEECQKTCGGE